LEGELRGFRAKGEKMSHIKVAVICFVAAVLLSNSPACAGAVTVELKPLTKSNELQPAGHLLINYIEQRNRTIMQVDCWGLKAATSYSVWGMDQKGTCKKIDTFTTNGTGSGNVNHASSGKFKYAKILVNSGDDKKFDNIKAVLTGEIPK